VSISLGSVGTVPAPAPQTRRPAGMLAGYLGLTMVPALLAARAPATGPRIVLGAHLIGLVLLIVLLRGSAGQRSAARSWLLGLLPLAAIPFLYAELPTLMGGVRDGYYDAVVQPWEYALFGGDTPARTLAPGLHESLGTPAATLVSELLFASYLSYYLIIYFPLVLLLVRRRFDIYGQTLTGVMATFLLCYLVFVAFPVEGPRYLWPAPDAAMHGPIRAFTLTLVEVGSSRGAEFPSSHVAVSVAQSIMALRWQRRLGIVTSVATALLSVAVVFAGFHYAIDVIAGIAVGGIIGVMMTRSTRVR